MKKLLVSMLAIAGLISCSTTNILAPAPQPVKVVSVGNCDEAHALVAANHEKIKQAFSDSDANTIGSLELINKAIIHSSPECFPMLQEHMEHMQSMGGM